MPPEMREELVENLRKHVDRLADLIGPRHVGRPVALSAAATLIERELRAAGYLVVWESYRAQGEDVSNLIAELAGSSQPAKLVVLGAHYDTVPTTPGADDNASAVAVLLEAARMLRDCKPKHTIRFVAFPCEEPPHFYTGEMGSQIYARNCRSRGDNIVGMLCLEMVGYYSTAANSQQLPAAIPKMLRWAFPRRGNFLAAVGNMRSLKLL
jgi:Zn-dependent M28 family amino/carboxypeptidase